MLQHKIELYNSCLAHIEDQIARANSAMANAQQDSNQQTKSSAGDKYETGRAMAQLDKERHAQALSIALQTKQRLLKINPRMETDVVSDGSIVYTNIGRFFLCVGMGTFFAGKENYTLISSESPIGQTLLHLEEGEDVLFRGRLIHIERIF